MPEHDRFNLFDDAVVSLACIAGMVLLFLALVGVGLGLVAEEGIVTSLGLIVGFVGWRILSAAIAARRTPRPDLSRGFPVSPLADAQRVIAVAPPPLPPPPAPPLPHAAPGPGDGVGSASADAGGRVR